MDDPEGHATLWYIITVGTTDEQHPTPRYLQGEIMGGSSCVIYESFVRSVQQVEDDDRCNACIYRFTVNKMILKHQSERKHELTNDMIENEAGKEL